MKIANFFAKTDINTHIQASVRPYLYYGVVIQKLTTKLLSET